MIGHKEDLNMNAEAIEMKRKEDLKIELDKRHILESVVKKQKRITLRHNQAAHLFHSNFTWLDMNRNLSFDHDRKIYILKTDKTSDEGIFYVETTEVQELKVGN